MKICVLLITMLATSAIALAGEVKITLPAETGTLKPGPGIEFALVSCLTCHSVEYISTQPPMKRAFWEASVKKMREKYGADAPDATLQQLIDYLTSTYGIPDKPAP